MVETESVTSSQSGTYTAMIKANSDAATAHSESQRARRIHAGYRCSYEFVVLARTAKAELIHLPAEPRCWCSHMSQHVSTLDAHSNHVACDRALLSQTGRPSILFRQPLPRPPLKCMQ
jgi:hypothetical protein